MRLSDREIHASLEEGQLIIVGPRKDLPFDRYTQVQACSVDLRLDSRFLKFKDEIKQFDVKDLNHVWDYLEEFHVQDGQPIVLRPNTILFGQIYEQLRIPPDASGKIIGRSRFARLGVSIHTTGDFINPEFEGAMPLQIVNHNPIPIVIYPYMTICQLILVKLTSWPLVPYPLRSSNPYHRERDASPSVCHTNHAISGSSGDVTLQAEIERRLVDNYLKERERVKLMEELAKGKSLEESSKLPQGPGGTIVISNSTIGVVNPGQLIGDIKSKISVITREKGEYDIGETLTKITEFLEANSSRFNEDQYKETLEILSEITKQAALPEAQRPPSGVLRTIIQHLGETIRTVAAGSTLWQHWGETIKNFFGI